MEVVYYPDLYVYSPETMKALLLCWGNIRTIVPPSHMDYIRAYLDGNIREEVNYPLEEYKKILYLAGEPVVDFLVISEDERKNASNKMLDLVCNWNKDTRFYESLKIHSIDDLVGKKVGWYWVIDEKLESPLVELLLEERLVVRWSPEPLPKEIVGFQEVGKSYMSIIAEEIKAKRNIRLITDDEFSVAAKSGLDLVRHATESQKEEGYQVFSMAIPQVFIKPQILKSLSWKRVLEIRQELKPLAECYHKELEDYQQSMSSLQLEGKDEEALDKFCEFCERVAVSFTPFSKETSKILKLTRNAEAIGFITGVTLPTIKLFLPNSQIGQCCDMAAISLTASRYALSRPHPKTGFEYLENLNRKLQIERMRGMVTCIIPKVIKQMFARQWHRNS